MVRVIELAKHTSGYWSVKAMQVPGGLIIIYVEQDEDGRFTPTSVFVPCLKTEAESYIKSASRLT